MVDERFLYDIGFSRCPGYSGEVWFNARMDIQATNGFVKDSSTFAINFRGLRKDEFLELCLDQFEEGIKSSARVTW